jgi:hypothetical protein
MLVRTCTIEGHLFHTTKILMLLIREGIHYNLTIQTVILKAHTETNYLQVITIPTHCPSYKKQFSPFLYVVCTKCVSGMHNTGEGMYVHPHTSPSKLLERILGNLV